VKLALLASVFALASCETAEPERASIFALAVSGAPGGALLSAWVEPGTAHRGWIVGGYVGVEPAVIGDGRVGRLVRYEDAALTTTCTTDRALWWVAAVRDGDDEVVFAAGEGGRVIRRRRGVCETLTTEGLWPEGAPTFWGILARRADDVTLVGGSTGDGPRGVIAHWDGARFERQDALLPADARDRNLYKIAEGALGAFIVGEGATLLRRDTDGRWRAVDVAVRANDNRLFTVSCDRVAPRCFAVGGASEGLVLRGDASGWASRDLGVVPGLAGVWMQDANSIFLVGAYGFTMHTNTISSYAPSTPETPAGLHAVAGNASLVLAVGGELATADATQRAVVLARGEVSARFVFDGRPYEATGRVRPTLGAGVGGSQ
jgi:hypothetical protein